MLAATEKRRYFHLKLITKHECMSTLNTGIYGRRERTYIFPTIITEFNIKTQKAFLWFIEYLLHEIIFK
jgi:hypothetical protein